MTDKLIPIFQLPNGPEDGGLAVMTGTAALFEKYFKEHQPVSSLAL